jgi:hypothetical protein
VAGAAEAVLRGNNAKKFPLEASTLAVTGTLRIAPATITELVDEAHVPMMIRMLFRKHMPFHMPPER